MDNNQPNWLREAVIYNILIDRFAKSGDNNDQEWSRTVDAKKPIFCGGTLRGIIKRLDYLQELGANTLLLTPFQTGGAYHGYHITDLYGVDSRFGTLDDVRELIGQAHKRSMRLVMDFVPNHVSIEHQFFRDARTDQHSPFRSWFYFREWPDNYLAFLNYRELAKLNLRHPDAREHIIQSALYWLSLGFDGLRIDHAIGSPHDFLTELRLRVKRQKREAVLLGEAVKGAMHWSELNTLNLRYKYLLYLISFFGRPHEEFIQKQYSKIMDGVFDFALLRILVAFMARPRWYSWYWLLRLRVRFHYLRYHQETVLLTLLDNADKNRFYYLIGNDREKYKNALDFQFAQNQPAMIYYGDEAGLTQSCSIFNKVYGDRKYGDLEARSVMPWYNIDWDIFRYYQKIIRTKKLKTKHFIQI